MQPESSDGFASVGTILPEERAALLPGGSFRFPFEGFAQWFRCIAVNGSLNLYLVLEQNQSPYALFNSYEAAAP